MSIKRKTEKAFQYLLVEAGVGVMPPAIPASPEEIILPEGRVIYTTQEPQTGRLLPCYLISCDEGDPLPFLGSNQEHRKILLSAISSAMVEDASSPEPAELQEAAVDELLDTLRSYSLGSNKLGSLARALTTAAAAAGQTHYTALSFGNVVGRNTEPIDDHLAESFELSGRFLEATC